MTDPKGQQGATAGAEGAADAPGVSAARRVGIGCFTAWLGLVSGAMVAVLVSKLVAFLTKAPTCEGIPSCDWYIYAMVGGGIGAVSLPLLVLWVLGKPARRAKT
jgi:hypothetical protein